VLNLGVDRALDILIIIISIGTQYLTGGGGLNGMLSKVPPGWKVCIMSIMGGFQTGNLLQCDEVHGMKVSLEF
jgi:hypothetical protein